jgi:hypothetical protein
MGPSVAPDGASTVGGALDIAAMLLLPAAGWRCTNLVAGASHIRLRDYLLVTLLGMMPGIEAITPDRPPIRLRAMSGR